MQFKACKTGDIEDLVSKWKKNIPPDKYLIIETILTDLTSKITNDLIKNRDILNLKEAFSKRNLYNKTNGVQIMGNPIKDGWHNIEFYWSKNDKKNLFEIEIEEIGSLFFLTIHGKKSKTKYTSINQAKASAFEVLENGKFIEYCLNHNINLPPKFNNK